MNRNSLLEMSGRVMHVVQRFTLNQSNDNPMMQELHLDGMMAEFRGAVERIQHFGFTSTPLPRDEAPQGSGAGGIGGAISGAVSSAIGSAVGGLINNIKGPAAEGICLLVGGQRNHPVCIAVDDRRHRPMGLKPGENAQYDDLGQMTLLRRTGLYLLSSDDVQPQQSGSGGAGGGSSSGSSQQQTARMASLRHVQKQPQQRPNQSAGSGGSGNAAVSAIARAAGATTSTAAQAQNYQHEGQTVNNEVRVSKGKIEFYTGSTVVGTYDKQANTWTINESGGKFKVLIEGDRITCQYQDNSHSLRVDQNHVHMKVGGNAIWVDASGCWSSQPIQIKGDSCS
jgi:phage gp45-like